MKITPVPYGLLFLLRLEVVSNPISPLIVTDLLLNPVKVASVACSSATNNALGQAGTRRFVKDICFEFGVALDKLLHLIPSFL